MPMNRFHLYFAFFRSTWLLSITVGVAIAVLLALLSGKTLMNSLLFIPTAGLGLDLLYKEMSHKEEYCFFHNQGISTYWLWAVTFLLSAGSCFTLYQMIRVCVQVWKWTVS